MIVFETDHCICTKNGNIAVLTINNPPQNFLMKPAFVSSDQLNEIISDEEICGLIITGAGRHFSAGADLESLFKMAGDEYKIFSEISEGRELLKKIALLNIPVLAAINGACWGGGLEIALACHIRIANRKSLFAFPEINQNLMPGLGGINRLMQTGPYSKSMEMLLSGDVYDARQVLETGIIDEITDEKALDYSIKYLQKLIEGKPKSVINSIMQAIHNAKSLPQDEALDCETKLFCKLAIDENRRRTTSI